MSYADVMRASRRTFIVRLLVEAGGEANESVIRTCAFRGGFGHSTADDIRTDLDYLREQGCVTEEWAGSLRVVTVTERGEDCARGKIEVEGVEASRWHPTAA
jgi:hypothetical protein